MSAPGAVSAQRMSWSMPVLWALIKAEVRKTLSTSAWWALLVPAALLCALVGLVTSAAGGLTFTPSLSQAIALGSFGAKFAVVFGVVCASAEFRHRTITTSYLTASGRAQLLLAKVVVSSAAGVVYAVVCSILGLLGMILGGGDFSGDDLGTTFEVSAIAIVIFALWAIIGVGLGALISNQLSAIIGVLVYLLLVEQLVSAFASLSDLGRIDDYLPGGAAAATLNGLAGDGVFGAAFGGSELPWWLTLLIFLGYALVTLLVGAAVAQSRDIT
jgi:ABC-type transport system involved in multi-copper enzyme maturation permease subunit